MASIQFIHVSDKTTASRAIPLGPTIPFRGNLYYTPQDLIAKRGLKEPKVPSVAQYRRRFTGQTPRVFPDINHLVLICAQAPDFAVNDDGEVSSRTLTDQYVARYCQLNNLKEC